MPRTVDVTLYHEQFPANRDKHCNRCVLHEGVQNVCVPTVRLKTSLSPTPRTPAVVVVGQNPGQQEDEKGLPFVGPSGALVIHGMIEPALIHTLATVYITNAVRCATEKNATPPMKCQRTCFNAYSTSDLGEIVHCHQDAPVVVLCLGAPASATVFRELFGFKKAPSQSDAFALNGRSFDVGLLVEYPLSNEDAACLLQESDCWNYPSGRFGLRVAKGSSLVPGGAPRWLREAIDQRGTTSWGISVPASSHLASSSELAGGGPHRPQPAEQPEVQLESADASGQREASKGAAEEQLAWALGSSPSRAIRRLVCQNNGQQKDLCQILEDLGRCNRSSAVVRTTVSITSMNTFHPAYLFRNPNVNTEIEAHMGQLQRFLTGDVPRVAAPTLVAPTPP